MRTVAVLVLWLAVTAVWADEERASVQVVEPYLELHTGPGNGYPVLQVVERGEVIEILKRRTDWFKIRTAGGKEGWVARAQMETTVTAAGVPTSFRDVLLDDYLSRRFEMGAAGGQIESDPLLLVRFGYRWAEQLTAEFSFGEATGDFSTSRLYYLSLRSEPFVDKRYSPFFSLGLGRFENTPRATLVERIVTESNLANAALGINVYITRRFLFRADFRRHVTYINEGRMDEYDELSAGFSFFF
jgi:hypothetical protein